MEIVNLLTVIGFVAVTPGKFIPLQEALAHKKPILGGCLLPADECPLHGNKKAMCLREKTAGACDNEK